MLNGDVLTDIDLTKQLEQHERTGARATLALIAVDDPSAYGLVRRRSDCSVTEFLEKPGADQALDINLVNAGAYILEREILEGMAPAGTNISIERDVFPKLVGHGLYGYEASGYWLDIGTPSRYLQATYDILEGKVTTKVGDRLTAAGMRLLPEGGVRGRIAAPVLIVGRLRDRRGRQHRRARRARARCAGRCGRDRRGRCPARGCHRRRTYAHQGRDHRPERHDRRALHDRRPRHHRAGRADRG